MKANLRKIAAILLLPLMTWLFFNRMSNWHYHELPNGIIIEHAHPYSKSEHSPHSPCEKHGHSEFEFFLLDMLFGIVHVLVVSIFVLRLFMGVSFSLQESAVWTDISYFLKGLNPLRGPPSI